jgi:hypothetical protein
MSVINKCEVGLLKRTISWRQNFFYFLFFCQFMFVFILSQISTVVRVIHQIDMWDTRRGTICVSASPMHVKAFQESFQKSLRTNEIE